MADHCLKCNQEIKLGKLIEIEGRKLYEKFDLNGNKHVCPEKSGKKFIPAKPKEEFGYDRFIESDNGKERHVYWARRTGYIGELDSDVVYKELEEKVERYISKKKGAK